MPEIAPFAAIRFNPRKWGKDISSLIAPPYDVLDEADKAALLAKSPYNIVDIDLPHMPPKSAGPPGVYLRSARMLEERLADGTFIRESKPALYLYHQQFSHEGRSYTRRMFIARARLSPFSQGEILPHEQTFGGPKEDRLALMRTTQCNLSPVFGLYSDPEGAMDRVLEPFASRDSDVFATLEGVANRLWVVTDRTAIEKVAAAMTTRKVYIADGHHRYETALRYCNEVAAQHDQPLPAGHPAHFVMIVLAAMEDPGCLILPYHRVLTHIDPTQLQEAWAPGSRRTEAGDADLVLVAGTTGDRVPLKFTARTCLAALEPTQPAAWHKLDSAYLHCYLIDDLLPAYLDRAPQSAQPKVEYVKSAEEAVRIAREQAGTALLLNATPMAHLRSVSEAGGLMPQKSTYFHPKLATGLTLNPLT